VPGDDEAEETIHSICLATRERRAHRGVLVVRAPMTVDGEEDGERSPRSIANPNPDPESDPNPDPNPYPNPYPNPDPNPDRDSGPDYNPKPKPKPNPNPMQVATHHGGGADAAAAGARDLLRGPAHGPNPEPEPEPEPEPDPNPDPNPSLNPIPNPNQVLLMDLSADPGVPPELYSRERRAAIKESERTRRPSRQTFNDPKPPARGYAFIPDLMKPLDDIYPCHGGGGDEMHLTPAREKLAWTSDAGKKTQEELSALFLEAMHAFKAVGFCLADDNVHDLPLVWVNDGFVTLSDYSRQQLIGNNCRFLQGDATDADTVRPTQGARAGLQPPACTSVHPACNPIYVLSLQLRAPSLQPHDSRWAR